MHAKFSVTSAGAYPVTETDLRVVGVCVCMCVCGRVEGMFSTP